MIKVLHNQNIILHLPINKSQNIYSLTKSNIMNTEKITLRIYTSRRDALLDIVTMETKEDALIIYNNLGETMRAFTIGNVTMGNLLDLFDKLCQDKNINI